MKLILTGGRGFLATHLSKELQSHGHTVYLIDRADADVADFEAISDALRCDAEIVVHFAAQVGRAAGEHRKERTIATNALGSANVAVVCQTQGKRLVHVSTSEIYGDQGDAVCYEDGPQVLPHNLYGLSKRWGEEAARLYRDGERLQILRPSMPYGPGLPPGWNRAAIINMLWQANHRMRIPVHKGGKRSWCWVGDSVRAMRMVIEKGIPGAWNIGRDDAEVSMVEVAEIACELTGAPMSLIDQIEPPPNQTIVKRLSMDKIRGLDWRPSVDLRDGMSRTLEDVKRYNRKAEIVGESVYHNGQSQSSAIA